MGYWTFSRGNNEYTYHKSGKPEDYPHSSMLVVDAEKVPGGLTCVKDSCSQSVFQKLPSRQPVNLGAGGSLPRLQPIKSLTEKDFATYRDWREYRESCWLNNFLAGFEHGTRNIDD